MMKTLQRGFTLIELLVVIAIIGILAAVVLASLNDARSGGQDASLKQSMTSLRSQAELYYNANGFAYTTMCSDTKIVQLLNAIDANSPATGINTTDTTVSGATAVTCRDNETQWAVIAPLSRLPGQANPTLSFCVDSAGRATTTGVAAVGAGVFQCPL